MRPSLQQKIDQVSNDYSKEEKNFKLKTGLDLVSPRHQNYNKIKCDEFLSIVISYYEGKKTLPLMLKRLEEQDYKNFEVIIVDDGSPTDIFPTIKKIKTSFKIKFARQIKNRGRSFTRNTGILMAEGQSIIFTDQDIIFSKNFVKKFAVRQNYTKKCVLLGFKEDIDLTKLTVKRKPRLQSDWRFRIKGNNDFIPIHNKDLGTEKKDRIYEILKETKNLKTFGFGEILGFWDLPATVISHGLCLKKEQAIKTGGFPEKGFFGWGAQDIAFGALLIGEGNFIVPVIDNTYFHINHKRYSGSREEELKELKSNLKDYFCLLKSFNYYRKPQKRKITKINTYKNIDYYEIV